uniref:Uncharacterized protein n=1 Tax=Triticum urartu TaxID=4572 RepID=A0A8R7QYC5_TRIUA
PKAATRKRKRGRKKRKRWHRWPAPPPPPRDRLSARRPSPPPRPLPPPESSVDRFLLGGPRDQSIDGWVGGCGRVLTSRFPAGRRWWAWGRGCPCTARRRRRASDPASPD